MWYSKLQFNVAVLLLTVQCGCIISTAIDFLQLFGFKPNPYGNLAEMEADLKKNERFGHLAYADGNLRNAKDKLQLILFTAT